MQGYYPFCFYNFIHTFNIIFFCGYFVFSLSLITFFFNIFCCIFFFFEYHFFVMFFYFLFLQYHFLVTFLLLQHEASVIFFKFLHLLPLFPPQIFSLFSLSWLINYATLKEIPWSTHFIEVFPTCSSWVCVIEAI